jgi:predicted secreted protein
VISWFTFAAWYVIGWWLVFFLLLPIGNRPNTENKVAGADPGAPVRGRLGLKIAATTVISAILVSLILYVVASTGLTLADLPLPSPPSLSD